MSTEPILELTKIFTGYGRIKALKGISLRVMPGEIVSIIGANGAGKSTTLMAICDIVPLDNGDISYKGKSIKGRAAESLPPLGLC